MKGVVFTEFLEMVEAKMGMDMVDRILDECQLPSGGIYTSLGTYDHREIVQMVMRLSEHTRMPVPALVQGFGQHLLGRFAIGYPDFFQSAGGAFGVLSRIEDHIHVEVRKLYPEAELPTFQIDQTDERTLHMTYRSSRPFADLAEGLIRGCIEHFREDIAVERHDLEGGTGTAARFELTRR